MWWSQSQLSSCSRRLTCGNRLTGGIGGRPPGEGPPPNSGRGRRGGWGGPPSSAAATCSIGSRCGGLARVPSSAALTSSIGSRSPGDVSSVTGGRTVVSRSSGGMGRDRRGEVGGRPALPARPPSSLRLGAPPPALLGTPVLGRSWCPSLFTGRSGAVARCPGAARPPRRSCWACCAQHVRLDQVIPAAGPTYLHHVYRKLVETGCQQDQLLRGARRAGHRPQMVAEYPGHQRQLLFAADRAHHLTELSVIFGGTQQIGVGVTHLGDAGASGVHLGQQ